MINFKACQFLPNIWIGNIHDSQDITFLRSNQINVIINCTKDLPMPPIKLPYLYRFPVEDDLSQQEIRFMTNNLPHVVKIIRHHQQQGHHILIHCYAGIQRSATVATAFLMTYYTRGNLKLAGKHLRRVRPIVFRPRCNFLESLKAYRAYLKYFVYCKIEG